MLTSSTQIYIILVLCECAYLTRESNREYLNKQNLEEELFINAEEVYGKDLKGKFKKLLFDISLAIIKDEYLVIDDNFEK